MYVDLHSKVYLLLIEVRSCDHCRPRLTFGLFFVVEQSNFDLFAKQILYFVSERNSTQN